MLVTLKTFIQRSCFQFSMLHVYGTTWAACAHLLAFCSYARISLYEPLTMFDNPWQPLTALDRPRQPLTTLDNPPHPFTAAASYSKLVYIFRFYFLIISNEKIVSVSGIFESSVQQPRKSFQHPYYFFLFAVFNLTFFLSNFSIFFIWTSQYHPRVLMSAALNILARDKQSIAVRAYSSIFYFPSPNNYDILQGA